MSYVLLDGKVVKPTEIDAAKHKFVGMFRPPEPILPSEEFLRRCPVCYEQMYHYSASFAHKHWIKGCFDVPQYLTIVEEE